MNIAGITILLLMLGFFKYCEFFVNSVRSIVGFDDVTLNIILPMGISFYTFTAISYLIDVYHRKYEAEKNILNFSLFIAFFPKLTAGPIVRGDCFLPQAKCYKGIRLDNLETGIQVFVIGLFKKMVLADHLGVFVDDVFSAPSAYNTFTVFWAVLSYALQIYFDFSGYSDIATGLAKMVGFDFPRNFNLPYISAGMSDFWKRWHISLSSWFQDYVYIPLGGSRKGKGRTYLNLFLVMLLSGLWHGAGWTFVLWGAIHGVVCCVSRRILECEDKSIQILKRIVTFITVSLLWIVFRANSVNNAVLIYKSLFIWHTGIMHPYTWTFFSIIVLVISTLTAVIKSRDRKRIDGFYPILRLNRVWTLTVFFTFTGLTIILAYFGNTAFIYGKF
ncbi:MAG: MBOAT family protein [Lachnospiraceae bacterium]